MRLGFFLRWAFLAGPIIHPVIATVVCEDCRPFDLQDAPGIGIDLTLGYGTAAIKFKNGTIIHVPRVNGSPEYISAMRTMAEDFRKAFNGQHATLLPLEWHRTPPPVTLTPFSELTPTNIYRYLVQQARYYIPIFRQPKTGSTDPWIIAVADMLSSIKSEIDTVQPLKYPLVVISVPDYPMNKSSIYQDRFQIAAENSGLESLVPCRTAPRAALDFLGIEDCFGDDAPGTYCTSPDRIDHPLVVSYSSTTLDMSVMSRGNGVEWGFLFPVRSDMRLDYGASSSILSENPEKYWEDVKDFLRSVIGETEVDRIVLLGSHAGDHDLRQRIREILTERHVESPETLLEELDGNAGLWTAAKGVASIARRGMIDGFEACIVPVHCKREEHDEI